MTQCSFSAKGMALFRRSTLGGTGSVISRNLYTGGYLKFPGVQLHERGGGGANRKFGLAFLMYPQRGGMAQI